MIGIADQQQVCEMFDIGVQTLLLFMMNNSPQSTSSVDQLLAQSDSDSCWPTFKMILQRLHAQGIYIHPDQLAEFLLAHGLPVDLCYVPAHLKQKAMAVNQNYQGDMANLTDVTDDQHLAAWE
jgi:hypothetical protein